MTLYKTPEPGIYTDVPIEQYLAWSEAVSGSVLLKHGRSAAHARQEMVDPERSTPAKTLGQAIHAAILEPERFEEEWTYLPADVNLRTNAGKKARDELMAAHPRGGVLREHEWIDVLSQRDAIWRQPIVRELLGGAGKNEVCVVWEDPTTGLRCKARADRITTWRGWTTVVELKSTRDATPMAFSRDAWRYGYYAKAPWYLEGLDAIERRPRQFVWLVVEKDAPFCVRAFEPHEDLLNQGLAEMRRYAKQHAESLKSDEWPGYAPEPETLALPPWARTGEEPADTEEEENREPF